MVTHNAIHSYAIPFNGPQSQCYEGTVLFMYENFINTNHYEVDLEEIQFSLDFCSEAVV